MCQLGLSFLLDSKLLLNQGRLCMWTRVENGGRSLLARITIIQCSYVRDLASSLRFPTKKAISLSAGPHEIRCSNWQSSAASNLGQGMRDQYKSSNHCCWQKAVNTSVFLKSKHHSLGVPEKVIGDLDRNTRAVMADVNIPPMYWDIVVQLSHC